MNWRTLGDTTLDAFRATLPTNSEIVKRGEVEAVYYSAQPHTRLVLGMLKAESSYATHFNAVPPSKRNPLNLRKRGQAEFDTFSSIAACVTEWKDRITSPTYAYKNTVTVRDLVNIYAPSFENDVNKYVATVEAVVNALPVVREEVSPVALQFGRVPHPPFTNLPITKPENWGQNNLGPRTVKGVVYHRILGSLRGTYTHFTNPTVKALTDYGVGVLAKDGASLAGAIHRWNDPRGSQSGWASGTYSPAHAYGDGAAFVKKYGINAINRDQVSIEISGDQNTPLDEAARESIAALTAYYADQYKVPWNEFPIAPQDGFSFVRWHEEFGPDEGKKKCPFDVVKRETPALIERTRAILKKYQTVDGAPEPAPEPEPEKPKHEIPEGETLESLRRYYGTALNPVTGEMEGFDLRFAPSQVWMAEGKKTGRWPKVREIVLRGNGDLRYSWEGGFHWTRKAKKED